MGDRLHQPSGQLRLFSVRPIIGLSPDDPTCGGRFNRLTAHALFLDPANSQSLASFAVFLPKRLGHLGEITPEWNPAGIFFAMRRKAPGFPSL
jgi:hypothetical protein